MMSRSSLPPARLPLRNVVAWSLAVSLGATLAASLTVKALAQTTPGAGVAAAPAPAATLAAAAPTPPAPSPAANPNPVPAATMAHSCAACHGTNGQLGDEYFKPLAGMPVQQFVRTMVDFREGKRSSTLMGHVAKGFTDADFKAMGEFFAAQKPSNPATAGQGAK